MMTCDSSHGVDDIPTVKEPMGILYISYFTQVLISAIQSFASKIAMPNFYHIIPFSLHVSKA